MTDTNMTTEWIERVVRENPIKDIGGGNFRTCPVRLSFPNIFERSKPIPPNTEGTYGANLIFPLVADLAILKSAAAVVATDKWAQAGTPQGPKLKSPFKDQGEMTKYAGYMEGGIFLTATSRETKPTCVDSRMAPIVDKSKVYPGVWAICVIRPFAYDKGVNKGVSFGLQSVMLVADDVALGGGSVNVQEAFGGVNIDANVNVNTAGMFDNGGTVDTEAAARAALFG